MCRSLLPLLCATVGCTPVSRLADLPAPHVSGTSDMSRFGIAIGYDRSVGCFSLSPDVHATVDGHPMVVTSRGGSRDTVDGTTCDPIWLDYQDALPNETTTRIELADGETTWSFEVDGLAPEQWSLALVAPSSTTVTEGQDFTVRYAPATTGVAIQGVYIDRMGVTAVTTTADTQTVHIREGNWSLTDASLHGTTKTGALTATLGPLVTRGCDGGVICDFETNLPDPGLPIAIAIP
jgi:hypothetical protein